ncbi:hypothetical protein IGI04_027456 [Brassica rapa subsp. trilocularis]|uniref:Uncharacterized protein n=1 Tax=Brassica rapa subsp. trilocularis TaxID=1813537 RepID=A0ABQ7KZ15_BRACM|nr:hypothetical protein IGI04_027456 [Brassica rapa subsp. trilocularis]
MPGDVNDGFVWAYSQHGANLKEEFDSLDFEEEKILTNRIARDIAKSVLRDGRFQSYLALGGPSWLHDRIAGETIRSDV